MLSEAQVDMVSSNNWPPETLTEPPLFKLSVPPEVMVTVPELTSKMPVVELIDSTPVILDVPEPARCKVPRTLATPLSVGAKPPPSCHANRKYAKERERAHRGTAHTL